MRRWSRPGMEGGEDEHCTIWQYNDDDDIYKTEAFLINSTQNISIHRCVQTHIIQICSGVTRGKVLNGELYAQRFFSNDWREICMKQPES